MIHSSLISRKCVSYGVDGIGHFLDDDGLFRRFVVPLQLLQNDFGLCVDGFQSSGWIRFGSDEFYRNSFKLSLSGMHKIEISHIYTFIFNFLIVLNMVEVCNIELLQVGRILNGNEIFPGERFIGQQFLPVLCLQVELLDSFM